MTNPLTSLPTWLLWVLLASAAVDIPIAGVLSYETVVSHRNAIVLTHAVTAARCWDRVLKESVTAKKSPAETIRLRAAAIACARLIP